MFKVEILGTPKLVWKELELSDFLLDALQNGLSLERPLTIARGIGHSYAPIPLPQGTLEVTITYIQSHWQPSLFYIMLVPQNSFDHPTHFDSSMVDNAVQLVDRIKIERITNVHDGGYRTFEDDLTKAEDKRRMYDFYRSAKYGGNNVQSFFDQLAFSTETELSQRIRRFNDRFYRFFAGITSYRFCYGI